MDGGGKRGEKCVCFFSCVIFVRVCVCENERTLGGDSRYLGPTDRHLALHQPSTTRPYGMLRNVTSWHRQSNAGVRACVRGSALAKRSQREHEAGRKLCPQKKNVA